MATKKSSKSSKTTSSLANTVARAKAMLAQTKAEGTKAFKGSSYDSSSNKYNESNTKAAVAALPTYTPTGNTVGLNASQVASLRGLRGIDQTLLSNYKPTTLNAATAPTNVASIGTQYPSVTMPNTEIGVTTPTPALATDAGTRALLDAQDSFMQQQLAREEQQKKESKPFLDKMLGAIQGVSDVTQNAIEQQDQAYNDYIAESKARSEEIKTYKDKYTETEAIMNQQLQDANGRLAPMSFINNQQSQIRNNAAPELNRLSAHINTLAAEQAAAQGDYELARSHIQDAVENVTALAKFQYDAYAAFYQQNQDSFDRVSKIYSDAFTNKMNLAKEVYDRQYEEKQMVGELLISNPQAGISITDSLEEAYAKINRNPMSPERRLLEAQIANTWSNAGSTSGSGGGGVMSSDTAIADGGDLSEMFSLVNTGSNYVVENNKALFNKYINDGNVDAAKRLVNTLAIRSMSAEQRNKFTGFGIINDAITSVATLEADFANTNPGIYRTLLENAKPWAQMSTDPRWQGFVAQIQGAINQYRNEIFGASITGNELKAANISLPNWEKDNYGTVMTKLRSMRSFGDTVRNSLVQNTTGQYTLQTTPTEIVQSTSVYDQVTGTQSDGGWFSRFLSWFR